MMFWIFGLKNKNFFKLRQLALYKIPTNDFQDLVIKYHEKKKDVESTKLSNRIIRARNSPNVNARSSAEAEKALAPWTIWY